MNQSDKISEIEFNYGRKIGDIYQETHNKDSDIIVWTDDWSAASNIADKYKGVIEEFDSDTRSLEFDYAFKITIDYDDYYEDRVKTMENTLKEIANYINNRGYDIYGAKIIDVTKPTVVANEDYIQDGFVSISDRVSPNITSGDRYDNLVEKITNLASELSSKWGNLIDIEFERNDEWYGFRVSLKRQMKTGGSIKSSGTFKPLSSAKELGITPKIAGHDKDEGRFELGGGVDNNIDFLKPMTHDEFVKNAKEQGYKNLDDAVSFSGYRWNGEKFIDKRIKPYTKQPKYAYGGGVGFKKVKNMEEAVVSFLTTSDDFGYSNVSVNNSQGTSFLFQYGTLIAKRTDNEVFISDKKYSNTTSRLQALIKNTAKEKGLSVYETVFYKEGGSVDKIKIGKYEIDTNTFEVIKNGEVEYKGRSLIKAKNFAKKESEYDTEEVYSEGSLEITRDANGNLHFDFDKGRRTGWAFDTNDVGVAAAIISRSSMKNMDKLRDIEISSKQLRDSDKSEFVYWLRDEALKIKKLMQKEKTIGGLLDLFEYYNPNYFLEYAIDNGGYVEYVYDEDYEAEKAREEEMERYENAEDYAKEYSLNNYSYKNREEILNDLINYFEVENLDYDEDRIKDIIKENFDAVDKKTLSIFDKYKNGGAIEISKEELENMVGRKLNGWNDDSVYYNGKQYQKCYLKPYYKLIYKIKI